MARGGVPVPKPEARKKTKARQAREDAQRLKTFRDAVWERAKRWIDPSVSYDYGRCRHCARIVFRNLSPHGEVHHRIPRSLCTPAQRYDPANGVLLCGGPNGCHGKAQRHEINV